MSDAKPSRQVIEAAARWAATLDADDATDADRAACARWCAKHPLHRDAWDRLQAFHDGLSHAGPMEKDALAHAMQARKRRRRQLAGGGIAFMLLLGAAITVSGSDAYRDAFPDYRTRTGEQRQVALKDGSHLTIDTDGAVNVSLDGATRRIRLVRGQILARVAPMAGHPFVVETPDGTATALGTRFVVRRDVMGTAVTVLESHVRACPIQRLDRQACTVLGPGEQVRLQPQRASAVFRVEPEQASLWASGWVEADDRDVGDLLTELNRYRAQPVRFDRQALSGLRVSGSYPLHDTDRAIEGIVASAHLTIDRSSDGTVTLRPAH